MSRTEPSGVTWTDRIWGADDLAARIYHPPPAHSEGATGAVVDVHGGAWNARDRTLGHAYNLAVAAAGLPVVAIDFRDGRQGRHPVAIDDISAAVAWVQSGAGLDLDPSRLAITGSSSGGHLALHAALTAVEATVVCAFWPPVDPLARFRYAKAKVGQPVPDGNRLDAAMLVASTEAYFGDEATMAEASIAAIVDSGRARRLPPVWLVETGDDLNVPASMLDELVASYRRAGGHIERTVYPGEIHGFGHGPHDGARRFRADLVQRLRAALG